jgi:hypothetical protein
MSGCFLLNSCTICQVAGSWVLLSGLCMDSVIRPSEDDPSAVFTAEPQAVAVTNRALAVAVIRRRREMPAGRLVVGDAG